MLSRRAEEYLGSILDLEVREGSARVMRIAERLCVKPPTVVGMLRRLADEGLISYELYCSIRLTDYGRMQAQAIRQRHEVFERLFELVGIPVDVAIEDACRFEHGLSSCSTEKLGSFFRYLVESKEGRRILSNFSESEQCMMKRKVRL